VECWALSRLKGTWTAVALGHVWSAILPPNVRVTLAKGSQPQSSPKAFAIVQSQADELTALTNMALTP